MKLDEIIEPKKLQSDPLYLTAFTHRSFLNESNEAIESNERLEFLGDSVLSLIISSKLFDLHPSDNEGDLTNMRSYLVKTTSLAVAAKALELGKYLRLSKGEEVSGGRENPQLLANTYEAVVGAIYVSDGLDAAKEFIEKTLIPLFKEELRSGPPKDSKSYLQEIVQNQYKQSPVYKILFSQGPDHARTFRVGVFVGEEKLGEGEGQSKQVAEEAAAAEAVKILLRASSG